LWNHVLTTFSINRAKEAAKHLKKRLQADSPKIVFLALILIDTAM
jgi:hypothetical protein